MATRKANPLQFLQKVGNTYYARVRVPRTLERLVGQSHLRKSLQTGLLAEAQQRKHAVVASLKAELKTLSMQPEEAKQNPMTIAEAARFREALKLHKAEGDDEAVEVVESMAVDQAERIEQLYGSERARRWFREAANTDDTLSELLDKWLSVNDYKESTKLGHRKALSEVLEFVKDARALPGDIDRRIAISYIDNALTKRGLARATIRDKIASLTAFWGWMASRDILRRENNPWTGHRINKANNKGSRPPKRAYTEEELLLLIGGNDRARKWKTFSYLPDLIVLGMYSACREEELCSLTRKQVDISEDHAVLSIEDSKTQAGIRPVGITHPAALSVLRKRVKGLKAGDQLFPELERGGADKKFSFSASKAFGRYRRSLGVPDGTDFHSFRRSAITVLESAGVSQVAIARYSGHLVGTIAADVYAATLPAQSVETSRKLVYPPAVEVAVSSSFLAMGCVSSSTSPRA